LHGHVELVCGSRDTAFLGHDPEVVEMLVVEGGAHILFFKSIDQTLSAFS
jgi:hypothetical protein